MKSHSVILLLIIFLIPSCFLSKSISHQKSPEFYFNQGKDELAKTDTYEAIKSFTRAIKLNPDYIEAYVERAKAEMSIDSIQGAIRDYDSLLVKIKDAEYIRRGNIYLLKGDALYLIGEDSLSCQCYEKSKSFNNNASWDRIRKRCKN